LESADVNVLNQSWHSAKRDKQHERGNDDSIEQSEAINGPMPNEKNGHAEHPKWKPNHQQCRSQICENTVSAITSTVGTNAKRVAAHRTHPKRLNRRKNRAAFRASS